MTQEQFKKQMSIILFAFGVISNIIGFTLAHIKHNGVISQTVTLVSIVSLISLFFLFFITKKYNSFIKWSVFTTGFLYFIPILIFTRNPNTFIFYTFILPASYSLSVKKIKDLFWGVLNLILIAAVMVYKIDALYALIYSVIYTYILIVTSTYAIISQAYTNDVKEEQITFKKMSERDELTKLYNRHYLQSVMALKEKWIPIMMDIDKFKSVNDIYGHEEGDLVLKKFASILLRYTTEDFMIFRYGGEEFLILSKLSSSQTDRTIIDLFNVVRQELHTSDRKPRTISVGIGTYGTLTDESISIADKNLYFSKEHGRNRISKNNSVFYE